MYLILDMQYAVVAYASLRPSTRKRPIARLRYTDSELLIVYVRGDDDLAGSRRRY